MYLTTRVIDWSTLYNVVYGVLRQDVWHDVACNMYDVIWCGWMWCNWVRCGWVWFPYHGAADEGEGEEGGVSHNFKISRTRILSICLHTPEHKAMSTLSDQALNSIFGSIQWQGYAEQQGVFSKRYLVGDPACNTQLSINGEGRFWRSAFPSLMAKNDECRLLTSHALPIAYQSVDGP